MNLHDIKNMDKNDLLGLLGLEMRHSGSSRLLGSLRTFGIGLLVGAGVALLLAPKAGSELRRDLRTKIGREGKAVGANGSEAAEAVQAASRRA